MLGMTEKLKDLIVRRTPDEASAKAIIEAFDMVGIRTIKEVNRCRAKQDYRWLAACDRIMESDTDAIWYLMIIA